MAEDIKKKIAEMQKTVNSCNLYLQEKHKAYMALTGMSKAQKAAGKPDLMAKFVTKGRICGRSGIREVVDQDGWHFITDVGPIWNGHNIGASAPSSFMAALNSCIMHTAAVIAAEQNLDMDRCECVMTADYYPLGGYKDFEDVPRGPQNIEFVLTVDSTESDERLAQFLADCERRCPVGSLLKVGPKGKIINVHGQE